MARRLARWLMSPRPRPRASLPASVEWQTDEGAFVDWARFRLLGGDELPELSRAYARCREAVIARRDAFARSFAQALVQWNAQSPAADGRAGAGGGDAGAGAGADRRRTTRCCCW